MKLSNAELEAIKAEMDNGTTIRQYLKNHNMEATRQDIQTIVLDMRSLFGQDAMRSAMSKVRAKASLSRLPRIEERFTGMVEGVSSLEDILEMESIFSNILKAIRAKKRTLTP